MPGGIQVFARALGMTTRELLKASEEGKLIASEVLPLVADELERTARNNDALNKSLKTSRSQWTLLSNQFKLLFDGFGSTRLDRGVASLIQAFSKLLKVLKPMFQGFFYVVGVALDLVGIIGKALLSAFDGFLNVVKALERPLKRLSELFTIGDDALMKWLQNIANIGVYFIPFIGKLKMLFDLVEEVVNIFTGHAQGFIAGQGETIGERLSNGIIAKGMSKVWPWLKEQAVKFKSWALQVGKDIGSNIAQGVMDGLKDLVLPDFLQNMGEVDYSNVGRGATQRERTAQIIINMDGKEAMEQIVDLKNQQTLQGSF